MDWTTPVVLRICLAGGLKYFSKLSSLSFSHFQVVLMSANTLRFHLHNYGDKAEKKRNPALILEKIQ